MNEKIERLITKLEQECKKQDLALVCTVQKGLGYYCAFTGPLEEIALALYTQKQGLDKMAPVSTDVMYEAARMFLEGERQ